MAKLSRIPSGLDDPKLLAIDFALGFDVNGIYTFDNLAAVPIGSVHLKAAPRSMSDIDGSWGSSSSLTRADRSPVVAANDEQGSPEDALGTLTSSGAAEKKQDNNPQARALGPSDAAAMQLRTTETGEAAPSSAAVAALAANPIFETRVASSADDAEERSTGSTSLNSSDLELTVDDGVGQTVGIRFTGIDIPKGAIITNAYIQFTVDEVGAGMISLLIRGQDVDDAAAFTTAKFNVTSRPTTDASVAWAPADWATRGAAGAEQRTPDLSAIIQEIVSRDGWAALNDMVFLITGTGTRTARTYDGSPTAAPLLHVEYSVPPTGEPVVFNLPADTNPVANEIAELAAAGTAVGITASATDPTPGDTVTYSIDDARFAIDANGVITRSGVGTLDFETQTTITLTVTATSTDLSRANQTFTVGLLNTQEPVAFAGSADSDPTADRVAQNAAAGTRVGVTASARDPDAGSTVSYGLNDPRFAIDGNGVITRSAIGTLNAQTEPTITLRVTATSSDGSTATHDYTVITSPPATNSLLFEKRVIASLDDVEEAASGSVSANSSDLELTVDGAKVQTVGMRFTGIDIPKGAIITNAYIQFTVDQVSTGAVSLMIRGQDVDDAAAFTTAQFNVSTRAATDASVAWAPADWTTRGAAGLAQRTPDLKAIVQEIIDRGGWAALNDMVLLVTGTGTRTARAFDSNAAAAPLLHIEYYVPPASAPVVFNTPPDADPATNQIAELAAAGTAIGITASASDPDAGATVTYSIDDQRFSIGSNGVITRSGIGTLDFETQTSITLTVTATSSDRSTATQTFTLGVLDSHEPVTFRTPADADTATNRIVQSSAAGTRVGITASASDPDIGSTVTYNLSDSRFAIDANGVITRSGTGTLNAQTEPSITLHVTATSSDGSTATHDYTLNVAAQAGPQTLYRFAVFGDFGDTSLNGEKAVSALIHSWNVDFALTVGDNVYAPQTLDGAVGQQYHDYIGNYQGAYGAGSAINRFFPVLGNHEYGENNVTNYLNYFTLPDNERYYDFQIGPVHFFALNSNKEDPDGRSSTSVQGQWMHTTLDASNASFNVAYLHHTAYNPSGSTSTMRWPFEPWGVNAVFAGHEHNYYRENRDDNGDGLQLPYTTTGLGGAGRDVPNVGASLVTITDQGMLIEFYNVTSFNGTTVTSSLTDTYFIATPAGRAPTISNNGGYVLNGTTAADYLWGLGSDATLTGGRGNDTLVGGKNSNLFVFQAGDGNDTIVNFRAGASTGDALDLRAYDIDSASEFRQVASNQGANVVANLSGTDHLTLLGVHAEQLHDDNFVRAGLLV